MNVYLVVDLVGNCWNCKELSLMNKRQNAIMVLDFAMQYIELVET